MSENNFIISSILNTFTEIDQKRDGKEKIIFAKDEGRIGYKDPYGKIKEFGGLDYTQTVLPEEERGTHITTMHEKTLSLQAGNELVQIKFIKLICQANAPTDLTINFVDGFKKNAHFIIGGHAYNDAVSDLMVDTVDRSSFRIQFNGGSGGEAFNIIAMGD